MRPRRDPPLYSLGDLLRLERRPVTVVPDARYAEIGIYSFGRGIFHKQPRTGLEVGDKELFLVKEGDFILQITFAWEGAVALASAAENGMYGSVRFPTFRVDENRCYPPYLVNYFRTAGGREQLLRISPGSAGRNRVLSLKRISEVFVALPALEEQRRVVARIDEVAARIDEVRTLQRQAAEEAQALGASSITRVLEGFPLDGCLGDVLLEKPRNGWSARCDNAESGTPVLTLRAITGYRYRASEFKRTREPTSPQAHYWLRDGDLLITRSNTPELVGHAAIYNGSPSPCIYPDLMMRLVVDEGHVDKRFVHYWLRSIPVREYIGRVARGTSPTMKKISQGAVMNIPFPSELALPEQHRIVAYLDGLEAKMDTLKLFQGETSTGLDALFPSVLDRAFKGEL